MQIDNPRIEQLFLVPGRTPSLLAQWGAAVLEYAVTFPGVYISHDYTDTSLAQWEHVTIVNPNNWPEDIWAMLKQNPRQMVVEHLTASTPEVLAEILHVRTHYNLRFGFETDFDWGQQWPEGISLIGLHGRGDGELNSGDVDLFRRGRIEAVKLTSHATGASVKALKAVNPNIQILVRPIMSFNDNGRAVNVTPEHFFSATVNDMQRIFDADPNIKFVEVHNEPNLVIEGLGAAWRDGASFANWFDRVVQLYRERWPDKKYGFPGLSPGVLNNVRLIQMRPFLVDASLTVARADWVSVHGYWGNEREMTDIDGGFTWKVYRELFPDKLLMVTEFGNPGQSKRIVADQYARYYGIMRHVAGMGGAFAYISSISDRVESARWAWRDEDGLDLGIADEIGLRKYIQ